MRNFPYFSKVAEENEKLTARNAELKGVISDTKQKLQEACVFELLDSAAVNEAIRMLEQQNDE